MARPEFELHGIVSTLPCIDAFYDIIEDISIVAGHVLQNIFSSDHLRPTGKQQFSFVVKSGKNGTMSCFCVAKVPLPFILIYQKYEEKEYIFLLYLDFRLPFESIGMELNSMNLKCP